MRDQYKSMADFCRSKITGGPDDTRWKEMAAHWDRLAERHAGSHRQAQQQQQQQQQTQAKPEDETEE